MEVNLSFLPLYLIDISDPVWLCFNRICHFLFIFGLPNSFLAFHSRYGKFESTFWGRWVTQVPNSFLDTVFGTMEYLWSIQVCNDHIVFVSSNLSKLWLNYISKHYICDSLNNYFSFTTLFYSSFYFNCNTRSFGYTFVSA